MKGIQDNSIRIRFASECKFESYKIKGQNVSYDEVMKDFLTNKKKLQIPTDRDKQTRVDKIDRI